MGTKSVLVLLLLLALKFFLASNVTSFNDGVTYKGARSDAALLASASASGDVDVDDDDDDDDAVKDDSCCSISSRTRDSGESSEKKGCINGDARKFKYVRRSVDRACPIACES